MSEDNIWTPRELILTLMAIALVLFVHSAIPFLMIPTRGQAVWTTGFSQSMANGSLFDFYAHDFGIPKPAAIAFGLAGAWPASLLIRLGLQSADAYAGMVMLWLGLAMVSAYQIARRFGATRSIALSGAVLWMTMPIIWAHSGYSMVSLGMALLSFYFLATLRLFLIKSNTVRIAPTTIVLYVTATILSVFMDGYTFMMFATGASILLLYSLMTRPDIRPMLLKIAIPVHASSFALAYLLFSTYIGKLNFEAHQIEFFRGWGLDLSFIAIPTEGVLWLPDLLGLSLTRTDELYFGDSSVWETTFALPVVLFGLLAWSQARHRMKISTGILLVAIFGFYMALGPSLKMNSIKPEALQLSLPREQSALMAPQYAVAPTGSAWISGKLPGFNVMRASYRWSALGVFAFWLLIVIFISSTENKKGVIWFGCFFVLVLLNLPDYEKRWRGGIDNRNMLQQIDQELVVEFGRHIRPAETVAFLPWGNDFMANYLAPKVGFRTFNIGGDKNLAAAQSAWPQEMLLLGGKVDVSKAMASVKMLIDGTADVLVLPYFHMLWTPDFWPCVDKTTVTPADEARESLPKISSFLCPTKLRAELQQAIVALVAAPYVDVVETALFATIRLRPEFSGQANRSALFSSIIGGIQYPIAIGAGVKEIPFVLSEGWHDLEAHHVWSKAAAKLLLPIPKDCESIKCEVKLIFGAFGASPKRPVAILFNSAEQGWEWSEQIKALSGDAIGLNVPLAGATGSRSIKITIPNATSPQLLIGSLDGRILGISLQHIELIKTK